MSKRSSRSNARTITNHRAQVKRRRVAAKPSPRKPAAKRAIHQSTPASLPAVSSAGPARVLFALDAAAEGGATQAALVMTSERTGMTEAETVSAIGVLLGSGLAFQRGERLYHARYGRGVDGRSAVASGDEPDKALDDLGACLADARAEALALPREWSMLELEKLSVAGLYAVAMHDGADFDPLGSMMREIADDLSILECLKINVEKIEIEPTDDVMHRYYFRLSQRARVAEELYRRQGFAVLEAVAKRFAPGSTP